MAERTALSKRVRFNVFKRDGFACQYCGERPPQVLLQVDHIIPVAGGGTNEIANLITACTNCNLGKSDIPLDELPVHVQANLADRKEAASQLAELNKWLSKERSIREANVDHLARYWCDLARDGNPTHHFIAFPQYLQTLRTFIGRMPVVEIEDSMVVATARFPFASNSDGFSDRTWRYFCGICWRKIKGDDRG